jgi:hypothetical protein
MLAIAMAALLGGHRGGTMAVHPGDAISLPPRLGMASASAATVPFGFPTVEVWTGSQVLTFGTIEQPGRTEANSGAAYEPATGEWRSMARSPFDAPLSTMDGFWTGQEMIIAGILCNRNNDEVDELACFPGSLALSSYDPKTDNWRTFDPPPDLVFEPGNAGAWGYAVGQLNNEAIFWSSSHYWAMNETSGSWRKLPDLPFGPTSQSCIVGDSLVALTPTAGAAIGARAQTSAGSAGIHDSTGASLAVLNTGTTEWREASPIQAILGPLDYPNLLCSDSTVLIFTHSLSRVWLFDAMKEEAVEVPAPSSELTQRPDFGGPVKLNLPTEFAASAWTGIGFVFWNSEEVVNRPPGIEKVAPAAPPVLRRPGNAVAFDPIRRAWLPAIAGSANTTAQHRHAIAWTNGFAFVAGLVSGQPGLQTYRPIS